MISKNFKLNDALPLELDSKNTLILVFYSSNLNEIIKIQEQFPLSTIVGCSTAGEIFNGTITDDLVISINKFDSSYFKVFYEPISNEESFKSGLSLAKQLYNKDLVGTIILSDGLNVNGSKLALGLKEILNTPIFGGLAGDGSKFQNTSVFYNNKFNKDAIIAIGFYGNLEFECSKGGGWIKFGPLRRVTKSEKTTIYQLDSKPALDLYKEYLGKESQNLPGSALFYPLSFLTKDGREITRTVLGVDENTKSITLAGEIPEGATVSLMHADYTELVSGAATCASKFKQSITPDSFSMIVSCVGRRMVLGEYAESELDAIRELQPIKNLVGFYSYGEIAPVQDKSNCELHNQSITLLNIKEF